MMRKTGMLICTNPSKFNRFAAQIQSEVKSTLYIQFIKRNGEERLLSGYSLSSRMVQLYKSAVCLNKLDVRVLLGGRERKLSVRNPIEIVYFDTFLKNEEMEGFVSKWLTNENVVPSVLKDAAQMVDCTNRKVSGPSQEPQDYVVLGGTFDRLHLGHKILLSEAAIRTKKKLVIGVTDSEMIKSKKLWELIEPYETRTEKIREFLEDVLPTLDFEIVPISDMYGPTRNDPRFQLLIVSAETAKGGDKVNEVRVQNNLNPLLIHCVDVIQDSSLCSDVEEDKVSSSNDRLRVLGTLIREPVKKDLPDRPYIIGLTGSIASGKTSISNRLKKFGAGVIDADKIAHMLYGKGESVYGELVKKFSSDILDSNGEVDRKKLGEIVFNDKNKLKDLDDLLWPAILKKCQQLIKEMHKNGHEIIVVEAALLIEAGWYHNCHEVWTCVIPPDESIRRIQDRNHLSEEEARKRVESQFSSYERVQHSNLVFSTLWSPDYTEKQVERAWRELQLRLNPDP